MDNLMLECLNRGGPDCHPDVARWKFHIKLKEGESIPTHPAGEELKELDDLCKNADPNDLEPKEGNVTFVKRGAFKCTSSPPPP